MWCWLGSGAGWLVFGVGCVGLVSVGCGSGAMLVCCCAFWWCVGLVFCGVDTSLRVCGCWVRAMWFSVALLVVFLLFCCFQPCCFQLCWVTMAATTSWWSCVIG